MGIIGNGIHFLATKKCLNRCVHRYHPLRGALKKWQNCTVTGNTSGRFIVTYFFFLRKGLGWAFRYFLCWKIRLLDQRRQWCPRYGWIGVGVKLGPEGIFCGSEIVRFLLEKRLNLGFLEVPQKVTKGSAHSTRSIVVVILAGSLGCYREKMQLSNIYSVFLECCFSMYSKFSWCYLIFSVLTWWKSIITQ